MKRIQTCRYVSPGFTVSYVLLKLKLNLNQHVLVSSLIKLVIMFPAEAGDSVADLNEKTQWMTKACVNTLEDKRGEKSH